MEIIKKAVKIGKTEQFIELSLPEFKCLQEAVKLLIPKKKKKLQKIEDQYEGQSDLYMEIQDLNQEIKWLDNVLTII